MAQPQGQHGPARYLVELKPGDVGFGHVEALSREARRVAAELADDATGLRFLRAVVVPEDGSCFLLWEAGSSEDVEQAIRLLGLGGRVSDAVAVGGG